MSTQMEREAAAWAFLETRRTSDDEDVFGAVIDAVGGGWFLPNGVDSDKYDIGWDDIIGAWAFHVRALDAANAAPVAPDPLAGVIWDDAAAVAAVASVGGPLSGTLSRHDYGIIHGVALDVPADVVLGHARAQLAREAADAGPSFWTECARCHERLAPGSCDHDCEAAPVAPAMTLDAMREALTAAGYEVVAPKVGGYERADLALTASQAMSALSAHDQFAIFKACFYDAVSGYNFDGESARLRALGVTPAVLK